MTDMPLSHPRSFPTTLWTEIRLAQDGGNESARVAIARLIEDYWQPVAGFLRCKGLPQEEAEDLTQDFFTHFLEKDIVRYVDRDRGRFRNFLLTAVSRYWAEKRRRASWRNRPRVHLDARDNENRPLHEAVDAETPDLIFARNWARQLVGLCLRKLKEECEAGGRNTQFDVFRQRVLEHPPRPAKSLAEEFGISEMDVANYQRRISSRFQRILQEEVRTWVAADDDVDGEIRSLLALFKG